VISAVLTVPRAFSGPLVVDFPPRPGVEPATCSPS